MGFLQTEMFLSSYGRIINKKERYSEDWREVFSKHILCVMGETLGNLNLHLELLNYQAGRAQHIP